MILQVCHSMNIGSLFLERSFFSLSRGEGRGEEVTSVFFNLYIDE